ncbi:FecCD family ABC transporter permease [Nitriliruptor alkaliphilus]|uniref:FecCD family ABC transporter permease n=1 Tax=Nitriliruptor alkaliphilus TaxID=427918 RepID=UPI0009FB8040|nr:iron chelate uptake ABC transporter family permease subunit [Nitriliruptor alkaliphilus]
MSQTATRTVRRVLAGTTVTGADRRGGQLTLLGLGTAALLVSCLVAVGVGQADISVREVWTVVTDRSGLGFLQVSALGLGGTEISEIRANVVWQLRLPRALTAAMVGGGLALVGAVMQTLMRNPMADPYLLGISSGASLGAVSVIVAGVGGGMVAVSGGAFFGALGSFVLVLAIAQQGGAIRPDRVILAGVAIGAFFAACTAFVILWVADPQATQEAQFWLSGSLAAARFSSVTTVIWVLVPAVAICLGASRQLNAFAFGADAAASLGIEVNRIRWLLLVTCSLLTGVLVAVSGAIGFVGLLVPHAVRFLVGVDHRRLLPAAVVVGGLFLLWVDVAARTMFEPREMPVGIITAMVGVPVFIWQLRRRLGVTT